MSKYIPVEPEKWAEMVKAQSDLPRWKEMCDELEARCNELKAEVERLRKAGDAMASSIQFKEEMEQDYNGPTIVRQCVKDWTAAKEGKQP